MSLEKGKLSNAGIQRANIGISQRPYARGQLPLLFSSVIAEKLSAARLWKGNRVTEPFARRLIFSRKGRGIWIWPRGDNNNSTSFSIGSSWVLSFSSNRSRNRAYPRAAKGSGSAGAVFWSRYEAPLLHARDLLPWNLIETRLVTPVRIAQPLDVDAGTGYVGHDHSRTILRPGTLWVANAIDSPNSIVGLCAVDRSCWMWIEIWMPLLRAALSLSTIQEQSERLQFRRD